MPKASAFHVAVTAAAVAASSPTSDAAAHVVANPDSGIAGRYVEMKFRVSHGCNGHGTAALRIEIPDGLTLVRPQFKPGWDVDVETRTLPAPLAGLHGTTVAAVTTAVIWRGGPLPDGLYDTFGLLLKLPERPGETLWFKTTQSCETREQRWNEIPAAGEAWGDKRQPAPFIRILPDPDETDPADHGEDPVHD
jgi:uncharacterized protein YcnI